MQTADVSAGIKALETAKFEEAEALFEKAVTAEPKDYSALFYLSLAQTFLNKDDAAMAGFRKVLEMKPGMFEAEINLGLLLYRYRRFEEAIPILEQARSHKPGDVRTLYHLAESLRETGDCATADPHYRKAVELDPTLAAATLGLARCLLAGGKLDEAAPLFLKAGSALELAQAYEDAGETGKIIPLYEAALKDEPSLEIETRLAGAYLKTRRFDEAEALIGKALVKAPEDFDLRLTHGRLLRDKRQFGPAAQEFARAVNLKPDSTEALNELAGMFISLNEDARAIAVLDRLKALGAETPGHLFFRAVVLDRNKQVKPALAAYRAFLEVSVGKYPDEEFKARQRARILEKEASRR